jgi:DNA-directed RNA polymerase specialized sigma24 family protein
MATARRRGGAGMDQAEELVRLLAIQIRLQLGNQTEAIIELGRLGFAASRIAELLGTTSNTVNVALNRAKREGRIPGRAG